MFSKQHEQELAEIKAMTHDLDQRVQEVLEELKLVKEAQKLEKLERQRAEGASEEAAANEQLAVVGKRRKPGKAQTADVGAPGTKAQRAKKARKRRPDPDPDAPAGKRKGKPAKAAAANETRPPDAERAAGSPAADEE